MFLQVFQLFIFSYLVNDGEGRHSEGRRKTGPNFFVHQKRLRKGRGGPKSMLLANTVKFEEAQNKPSALVLISEFADALKNEGGKNPKLNKVPKSSSLTTDINVDKSVRNRGLPRAIAPNDTIKKIFFPYLSNKRNRESAIRKNAKKFWNHFMFKMNAASQDLMLPIKTQAVQQETCKALPFSQNIVHENCDKLVIQNNVCFGKCNSFHMPGLQDPLYTCSHCLPSKFTMNHLELNCTESDHVVKVIMVVKECKCEVQKSNHHQTGFFNMDLGTGGHD
ncbi:hypothetical protein FKM82_000540 [Ascaphus truei]